MLSLLSSFLFVFYSSADDLSIKFNAASLKLSGDAVLNLQTQSLHPPLEIFQFDLDSGGAPAEDRSIIVGDGSHGVFYVEGATVNIGVPFSQNGNVITIDTDVVSEINVTSFELGAGKILKPEGTKPLIIRSQSDVIINGSIICSGDDGEDLSPLNNNVAAQGGQGRCGGYAGGDSGTDSQIGQKGFDSLSTVTGGGGGDVIGAGNGGGGGGAFYRTAYADSSPIAGIGAGGAVGVVEEDHKIENIAGGAGGGGGSSGSDSSNGAAGGAGGGLIFIYAINNIDVQGGVYANGGKGGEEPSSAFGGGGGGGGGGTVVLYAGVNINIDGAVDARPGSGGITNGNNGGQGSIGRTWVTDGDGIPSGGGVEYPESELDDLGSIKYQTGNHSLVLMAQDTKNSRPKISSTSTIPAGVTVEVYSSDSPNETPTTGFAELSTILNQSLNRYLYFKITLTNADQTNPVSFSGLDVVVDEYIETDFQMQGSCGSIDSRPAPPWSGLLLFILPLFLVTSLRRYRI